ncbi:MAG: MFS transporter [Verrucomicrobia bacterium Tous-C9LFEB]|nr:MAG: MFS transporter [Verrucomicrobia bacterium Tous-C9LFEB]
MASQEHLTVTKSVPTEIESPAKIWKVGTLVYTSSGISLLFCWLLVGDFAWSMRDRSVAPMSQWYLDQLRVPGLVFGLLVSSLPAVIQLIIGPLISVKSDRYRSRWGRRIPFLLITTPLAALGMIGLGLTPLFAKWLHGLCNSEPVGTWLHQVLGHGKVGMWALSMLANEMVVSVVCFSLFWTSFEVASIAGKPLFDGLINDVVPRPLLGRFYGLFRAVSLLDGMIFNYWLIGYVPGNFTVVMICIGFFYGTAFTWVCLRVKEGSYPVPPEMPHTRKLKNFTSEMGRYCRECFSNSYYLYVFGMIMLSGLCFVPVNVFAIPFAKHVGVDMATYGKAVALTYLISMGLAYFLGWLADRFHPLRVSMAVLTGYAFVAIWGSLFARNAETYLTAWVLHGVLSGCYFTSAASLGLRLFPHEKFAQFASAAAMFGAFANIFMAPMMGMIIDYSGSTYRYTYGMAGLLALLALGMSWMVYIRFERLGGVKAYQAP